MSGLLDIYDFECVLGPSDGLLEQEACNLFLDCEEDDDLDSSNCHHRSLPHSKSHSSALSHCQTGMRSLNGGAPGQRRRHSSTSQIQSLPPEVEEGNVEYKLKLINPTPNRLQQLITQMKWRLKEGGGKAIYELGVCDNGELLGLNPSEVEASLETFNLMAKRSGAKIDVIREKIVNNNNKTVAAINQMINKSINKQNLIANKRTANASDSFDSCGDEADDEELSSQSESEVQKVLEVVVVKKTKEEKPTTEVRVIMLGNVGSGKSSLLGVLTQGDMDDGRGRARINLFRHQHELQSGRTSSISKEILGIDSSGLPINYSAGGSQEICDKSRKLIVFIDSGGHPKYLKTTVFTMTAMHADYAILVIDPQDEIDCETNRLHLNLALSLELPILVVINKTDLQTESQLKQIIAKTQHFIANSSTVFKHRKSSQLITTDKDLEAFEAKIKGQGLQDSEVKGQDKVPIFLTSCVTGQGIDIFQRFLHFLKPTMSASDKKKLMKRKTIFQIDETFRIPSVGLVVSGFLASGRLKAQDVLKAGPLKDGSFVDVEVVGLQRHKVSRKFVVPGETSTLALKLAKSAKHQTKNGGKALARESLEGVVRRGMCLLSRKGNYERNVCDHFAADVFLMPNSEPLTVKSQVMVFCENVRQRATVIYVQNCDKDVDKDSAHSGDKTEGCGDEPRDVGKNCDKIGDDAIRRNPLIKGTVMPNETATVILQFNRQPEFLDSGHRILLQKGTTNAVGRVAYLNPLSANAFQN